MRLPSALLVLLLIIAGSIDAHGCDAGRTEYFGRCTTAAPPSPKLLKFLKDYGRPVGMIGEDADLFAPDVPLFDKPGAGRKTLHTWRQPNIDVESEARIEDVLPEFYVVTVRGYNGPTSCGIEQYKQKGPNTTLRGYVPKISPQGLPSLWKFKHMSGLC